MANDIVLVTGTSSSFGEMIALELARAGYTVYASMREAAGRNKKKADDYAALSKSEGIDVRALDLAVTNQASVELAIARVVGESGRLDVVVHNAGHMSLGPTEAFTVEQLAELYDVNAWSTQRVNRCVLRAARQLVAAVQDRFRRDTLLGVGLGDILHPTPGPGGR